VLILSRSWLGVLIHDTEAKHQVSDIETLSVNANIVENTAALNGPIVPTFIKYLIPSLLGLIAMTSASLVDGIFIGNYVGTTALAAVNLIIPITTLMFGVGLMLSIGGSVRCGKYLGEKKTAAASAIFSKTLLFVLLYGCVAIVLALIFETHLFSGLGATPELFPVMSEYYRIIMPFLLPQLITVVLYFFVRMDGAPNLAAAALMVGSIINIVLDYVFIAVYGWGLEGAAYATGLSQLFSLSVLMFYFTTTNRVLIFRIRQSNWREVFQAAYNGISEFINEISGGIIALVFNWMLIQRAGVDGVAAITVVNYLLMLGFMAFFAISDSIQVMVSQNFGAGNSQRIRAFMITAMITVALVGVAFISALLIAGESLILMFVDDQNSGETVALANSFITYVWPLFLFVGFNMLVSGYLTAIHLPFQSGLIALCRSLVFPASLLILFYFLLADNLFIIALSVAEAISFVLAVAIFWRYTPAKVMLRSLAGPS
jgi:putative MATE family efflux protein